MAFRNREHPNLYVLARNFPYILYLKRSSREQIRLVEVQKRGGVLYFPISLLAHFTTRSLIYYLCRSSVFKFRGFSTMVRANDITNVNLKETLSVGGK